MKSERRHELHQNLLEQNLSNAGQYIKAHSNLFVWSLLVVAVLVLAAVVWHRQAVRTDMEFAKEYHTWVLGASLQTGSDVDVIQHHRNIIDNDKNTARAASAAYELGNLYYGEYLSGSEEAQRAKSAEQAKQMYNTVVTKFPQERILLAKAHFVLGKLAEGQGDFKQAEKEYNTVQGMTDLANVPVVEYAVEAVKLLPSLEVPVVLATTKPSTEPSTAPSGSTSKSSSAPAYDRPTTAPATAPTAGKPTAKPAAATQEP